MNQHFYLNANEQPAGEHEVHRDDCYWMPASDNRLYLGIHESCGSAVGRAQVGYPAWSINGCMHCSIACHTG